MDYRSNAPIPAGTNLDECTSGGVRGSIKSTMDETNSALGELKAQLDELGMLISGSDRTEDKPQTPALEVCCMADQAEVNRRLAVACLKQFVRIKQSLI